MTGIMATKPKLCFTGRVIQCRSLDQKFYSIHARKVMNLTYISASPPIDIEVFPCICETESELLTYLGQRHLYKIVVEGRFVTLVNFFASIIVTIDQAFVYRTRSKGYPG